MVLIHIWIPFFALFTNISVVRKREVIIHQSKLVLFVKLSFSIRHCLTITMFYVCLQGVVLTHGNMEATTNDMVDYWQWTSSDSCLHVLPLHHVHGLINALHVPLSVGAKCVMLPKFSAQQVTFETICGRCSI